MKGLFSLRKIFPKEKKCIVCGSKRDHQSGLCEPCEDDWAHSGMSLNEYVVWRTGKTFVEACKEGYP